MPLAQTTSGTWFCSPIASGSCAVYTCRIVRPQSGLLQADSESSSLFSTTVTRVITLQSHVSSRPVWIHATL
jgi:hypothetical protein